LLGRFYLFAAILGVEVVALASIPHAASLLGPLAPFGIVCFAVFVGLGHSKLKLQQEPLPFGSGFLALHLLCFALVCAILIAAHHGFPFLIFSHLAHLILRLVMIASIALLALACVPFQVWIETIRVTKWLWLYAVLAGAIAWCLRYPLQSFWDSSSTAPGRILQVLAFHSVKAMLRYFLPNILVDPASFTIGTPNFAVTIAEACSGMEGLGLVTVFTVIWLWYFRRESRFPQALLLIPCALLCVWMLNIVRIATLVLIGNAGAPDVAMVGFHSQAGWIAFTTVAFCFSMATRNLSWVRRIPAPATASSEIGSASPQAAIHTAIESGESPATAAYLVPFLAILGASFLTKSVTAYFEWAYPLRFFAAIVPIWIYRAEYRKLNWRFSWLAPFTGAVIFLLWIAPSLRLAQPAASTVGIGLAGLAPGSRWAWIAFRIAAAVLTVPLAEELAFRGYLSRRLIDREFDTVPFSSLTVLSIGLSSVAFGLMHGAHWIAGIVAGLAFALLLRWKGRFGDAVVAHATSNLLLAIWVLARGDWAQW
jgi:exosortase E/protease (VPEID-CTERM system)